MRALTCKGVQILSVALPLATSAFAAEPIPGEEGGLPQLDAESYVSQVFWLLLTFAALYLLMSRVFLPRLGGVIEERRNRIADDYDQAAEFKQQAEEAQATYERSLADAKARAASIAAETKASIDAEIAEMEAENEQRLEARIQAAERQIAESAEAARDAVLTAARQTTTDIVAALTGRTPSEQAVDAALATVKERRHAAA